MGSPTAARVAVIGSGVSGLTAAWILARDREEMGYAHPVYDVAAVAAQARLPELNDGVTAFAGAYHGWGFGPP
jgi:predicted NAD/FAD-binding protein